MTRHEPLSQAMYAEIARWNDRAVVPTHLVMSWDVLERLAVDAYPDALIGDAKVSVWGLPVVVVPGLNFWAVGSDVPSQAERMRAA